jgi:hypothetical protein
MRRMTAASRSPTSCARQCAARCGPCACLHTWGRLHCQPPSRLHRIAAAALMSDKSCMHSHHSKLATAPGSVCTAPVQLLRDIAALCGPLASALTALADLLVREGPRLGQRAGRAQREGVPGRRIMHACIWWTTLQQLDGSCGCLRVDCSYACTRSPQQFSLHSPEARLRTLHLQPLHTQGRNNLSLLLPMPSASRHLLGPICYSRGVGNSAWQPPHV